MNETIKQFMIQAGTDTSGKWMSIDNAEKFAELIVQECVNELLKWKSEPFPFDAETGARVIKDLFKDKQL
jgi:coenzyme F420-reducing hydrogenase delta subunit